MKKFNKVNKCITKRLDGKFDWFIAVWTNESFFARFTIKNVLSKSTEEEAKKDMNRTLSMFK